MQSDWTAYTQALALRATTNTLTPMEQDLLRLHARHQQAQALVDALRSKAIVV
jgi:hypothetical protein